VLSGDKLSPNKGASGDSAVQIAFRPAVDETGRVGEPFIALGIPAVELMTEPGDYDADHHSVADTLDKVDSRALSADTAGMALAALAIANADRAPGRRLQAPEILELLKRTGLLDEARLLRGNSWLPQ